MPEETNLYKIETFGNGTFWVLARNFTEAEDKLIKILNDHDYGFSSDRKAERIDLITTTSRGLNHEPLII